VLPLADRAEAAIREEAVTAVMPPIQISRLLEGFVTMRMTYLQLRYRYVQLYRLLELEVGCRLADLQGPSPAPFIPEQTAPPRRPIPVPPAQPLR